MSLPAGIALQIPGETASARLNDQGHPTYTVHMKAIQVMLDEDLVARLDASEEVRAEGRSAVLRRAAAEYLDRRRREAIAEQYRNAYADGTGLGEELEGWEDQGSWPKE